MRKDWSGGPSPVPALAPGDYGKDKDGVWWARVPADESGKHFTQAMISKHTITEHEDGTITVSPSILMSRGDGLSWHGYLRHGVWEKI